MGDFVRQRRYGHFVRIRIGDSVEFSVCVCIGNAVRVGVGFPVDLAVGFCVGNTFELAVEFTIGVVMSDLTIIYLTVNQMPPRWQQFHLGHLLRATEGRPMVVISAKPMDLGRPNTEYLTQTGPFCAWNVYRQLLRGASLAETKYVGIAEDDTLYPRRHFSDFRPPDDAVAYDMSRWSIFSWVKNPFFSAIRKCGNFSMIGPRQLVIDALEEREEKYPRGHHYTGEIGRADVERVLGVTRRKHVEWWCIDSTVNLAHPQGLSPTYINTPGLERKPGELKAWDIPIWGKASDITDIYNQGVEEDAQARLTETS